MASLVSKEQWMKYMKQREEEAHQEAEAWIMEQIEKEQRKREVEKIAKETAERVAKDYIDSQRRRIQIEVDERSLDKAIEELYKRF